MSRPLTIRQPQVKRTPTGGVRFCLGELSHNQLRHLLLELAAAPPLDMLADISDVAITTGRLLAMSLVTRRPLLMTLATENRFVLPAHEAAILLQVLWVEVAPGSGYGALVGLFGDLHKLLS